jgi:hypothetical protein
VVSNGALSIALEAVQDVGPEYARQLCYNPSFCI